MTAKQAFEEAIKNFKVSMGKEGQYFTALIWKSPESGKTEGPFLVTMSREVVIEVNEKGEFSSTYLGKCDHYYPYYSGTIKSERPGL